MGNAKGQTARSSEEFESALRRFTQAELQDLKKLYHSLALQSRSEGQYVSASVFQAYLRIHGSLGTRLFNIATQRRGDQRLLFEDLVIAKALYEKGSPGEIDDILFQLLDLTGDGMVQRTEVEAVVLSVLQTVLDPSTALPEDSIQGFLKAATFSVQGDGGSEECMSFTDFKQWCSLIPAIKKFLGTLLTTPSPGMVGRQVPRLLFAEDVSQKLIMRREYAWHISAPLQQQDAQHWVLLYNSSVNGVSFNTLLKATAIAKGPTIVLIKDKEGYTYGGYASQPWEKHSNFYGDMKCFLFTLHPMVSLYRPSGANTNLQWCAFNYTSESIPNGIGFGGQIHHFGLFLSGTFEHGHTHQSVTYSNPALSGQLDIVPDIIECWAVVPEGEEAGESGSRLKGTILERFKEDRNMLNMMGMANASESI